MANLVRWDPFGDFDRMDRTFDRMVRRAFSGWSRPVIEGEKPEWSPSANISETDKEYLIRAELPAVKKEDVKVTVDGGMITIEGERKQLQEEKGEKYHRIESSYGSFVRSFSLPDDVGHRCHPLRRQGRRAHRSPSQERKLQVQTETDHCAVRPLAATARVAPSLPWRMLATHGPNC